MKCVSVMVAVYGHNDRFVHHVCELSDEKENGTILSDKDKERQQQVEMCHFLLVSLLSFGFCDVYRLDLSICCIDFKRL